MSDSVLAGLNDDQIAAVSAPESALLVLAGAGSGKTKVLVQRIVWLLQTRQVSPMSLMAVTFTNKAAAEMRARAQTFLGDHVRHVWLGTFHGLANRLLRIHWEQAGLPRGFQILDQDDQQRLLKKVIAGLELDEKQWQAKSAQHFINNCKDEGQRPAHVLDEGDPQTRMLIHIYAEYESACQQAGVVDFAELLLRAHELLRDNPDLLAHYRQRFQHVLVDEFQDTNAIQYAWLRLLTDEGGNAFVVGDDDQSIYGWRGAKVENVQAFQDDFAPVRVVRLEQNYRSTGHILKAANALIRNNDNRLGKELWTADGDGEPLRHFSAFNEREEASYVIGHIQKWLEQGGQRRDVAILYRSNAVSRAFEEALVNARMPYRVFGGARFFDRAEIKDCLAYLRLVSNRDDDVAFERVVNTPTRGVGGKTVGQLRQAARDQGQSLWQVASKLAAHGEGRAAKALTGFVELINELAAGIKGLTLSEQVEQIMLGSGLQAHYKRGADEQSAARLDNLGELISAAAAFVMPEDEEWASELDCFLSHAALEAGERQGGEGEDCVQLMTLHSSKGLEFPLVFLVAMEEGLFPSQQSMYDPARLNEERRLAYVGITRAMQQLFLTTTEQRRVHGKANYMRPSRFLREIPAEHLQVERPNIQLSRPQTHQTHGGRQYGQGQLDARPPTESTGGWRVGQPITHGKFGDGVILAFQGEGERMQVQINFSSYGVKWLMLAYANLRAL